MSSGVVFDIREFSVHDGPGIRTTVFLKGCPLRCAWCHNPEGQSFAPQPLRSRVGTRLAGARWEAADLAARLNRQAAMLRAVGGGVTFSGGEPLAQPDFLLDVIGLLDRQHVLLETSGQAPEGVFAAAAARCDMLYFDLKLADPEAHRRFTGTDNALILRNFDSLCRSRTPFVARVPLVPGVTDTAENLEGVAKLLRGRPGLVRVDLLPYNLAAGGKYEPCGMKFSPAWDEARPCRGDVAPFLHHGIYARVA